ncbi:hypothetical protein KKI24_27295 [bacterium]|nr:hypothetical protein [bacterium]
MEQIKPNYGLISTKFYRVPENTHRHISPNFASNEEILEVLNISFSDLSLWQNLTAKERQFRISPLTPELKSNFTIVSSSPLLPAFGLQNQHDLKIDCGVLSNNCFVPFFPESKPNYLYDWNERDFGERDINPITVDLIGNDLFKVGEWLEKRDFGSKDSNSFCEQGWTLIRDYALQKIDATIGLISESINSISLIADEAKRKHILSFRRLRKKAEKAVIKFRQIIDLVLISKFKAAIKKTNEQTILIHNLGILKVFFIIIANELGDKSNHQKMELSYAS